MELQQIQVYWLLPNKFVETIQIIKADLENIIQQYCNNDMAFAHCISADFNSDKHMRRGVSPMGCVRDRVLPENVNKSQLSTGATILVTSGYEKYNESPIKNLTLTL